MRAMGWTNVLPHHNAAFMSPSCHSTDTGQYVWTYQAHPAQHWTQHQVYAHFTPIPNQKQSNRFDYQQQRQQSVIGHPKSVKSSRTSLDLEDVDESATRLLTDKEGQFCASSRVEDIINCRWSRRHDITD